MTRPEDDVWYDEDAGPLVRPYAITRGRTPDRQQKLELISLIVSLEPDGTAEYLEPEYASIVRLCQQPISVAELSAELELPLGVVKVLVSDLIERGLVVHRTSRGSDPALLRQVLHGLHQL
jgi:hypothetical protein